MNIELNGLTSVGAGEIGTDFRVFEPPVALSREEKAILYSGRVGVINLGDINEIYVKTYYPVPHSIARELDPVDTDQIIKDEEATEEFLVKVLKSMEIHG
jgi:hypothetical protein